MAFPEIRERNPPPAEQNFIASDFFSVGNLFRHFEQVEPCRAPEFNDACPVFQRHFALYDRVREQSVNRLFPFAEPEDVSVRQASVRHRGKTEVQVSAATDGTQINAGQLCDAAELSVLGWMVEPAAAERDVTFRRHVISSIRMPLHSLFAAGESRSRFHSCFRRMRGVTSV